MGSGSSELQVANHGESKGHSLSRLATRPPTGMAWEAFNQGVVTFWTTFF